jgi:hypothetical protein
MRCNYFSNYINNQGSNAAAKNSDANPAATATIAYILYLLVCCNLQEDFQAH